MTDPAAPSDAVRAALREHRPLLHPERPDWARVECGCGLSDNFAGWWAHITVEVVERTMDAVLRLPAAAPVDPKILAEAMKKVRTNKENIDLDGRFDLTADEEAAGVADAYNRLAGQSDRA